MKFPLGAMTVGDILDRGLRLLLARFPTFLAIYLIIQLPLLAYQILVFPEIMTGDVDKLIQTLLFTTFGVGILTLILVLIGSGAIVHVVAQEYIDNRVGVGGALSVGLSRFGALLWTSILTGIVLALGFFACCLPFFFFIVWFDFIGQVVVMEGRSGTTAMSRSMALGKGYRWRIFGMILLLILVGLFLQGAAGLLNLVVPYGEVIPTKEGYPVTKITNYTNFIINTLFGFVVSVVVSGYQSVCTTLLYLDLRIRKEGFDLEVAARQLAGEARPERAQDQW